MHVIKMNWRWYLPLSLFLVGSLIVAGVLLVKRSKQAMEYNAFHAFFCMKNTECIANTTIPKVIYRTAKSSDLSTSHQKAWDYTQKHNPDFKQVLLNDAMADAFMKKALGGTIYDTYARIVPGAAKADLLRYTLMYELGGVYLDIKSGAKSLCHLLRPNDKMLVASGKQSDLLPWVLPNGKTLYNNFGEIQQWWLVSAAKHPIMLAVVNAVVTEIRRRVAEGRCKKESVYDDSFSSLFKDYLYTYDIMETTGPIKFGEVVLREVNRGNTDVRLTCANGNDIFVYDVAGDHAGGAGYSAPGKFFRCA